MSTDICELCGGSGEVVVRPRRLMGATYWDGECGDEQLGPCPCCAETEGGAMSDNAIKKSVRGVEKLLIWLGWTVFTVILVTAFFAVFILPYLLLFLGSSEEAVVVAVLLFMVQFFAAFYILCAVGGWLERKLQQLHEWAHTINGRV